VAVIVAAFNEERHIADRIRNILAQDYPADLLRLYVGSDGSSDRTVEFARAAANSRVQIVDFEINRGKASVLNDLVAMTGDDILVFTDANTEFEERAVAHLVEQFRNPVVGAACGELHLRSPGAGSNEDHTYWGFEQKLKAAESRIGGLLGANGGVYAIRRELYRTLDADMICDDFVTAMDIAASGWATSYVPEAAAYEDTPADVASEYQRRVRIGIGNYQVLFRRLHYFVSAPVTLRFTYFSHKVLRWLTPHLLLTALISSGLLSARAPYAVFFAIQVGAYLLIALAYPLRSLFEFPRVLRAAVFFFTLNVAFLHAYWRYLRGSYRGSWKRTERA
jgi:cellulose synthase/poly-beta-1,6-N-acetylglucosamine synthase-like glycosyltransferase